MSGPGYHRHDSSGAHQGASPWTIATRVKMLAWEYVWLLTCVWTPKPWNRWRLFVLRRFGATISGRPFVHQRTRIQVPWNLTLHDRACTGDRSNLYSLARITIGAGAVVAQEAYLCTGTHDFADPTLPLLSAPIAIEARAFVGARAMVLPGITVGAGAVVGACAVVTKDVAPAARVKGNPAR